MKVDLSENSPETFLIRVEGEVDMSSSPELRKALLDTFTKKASRIVVDLSAVTYIDSSGIATLIEGLKLSRKGDVRFILAGAGPSVEAVFELAYLKGVFEMVPDMRSALEGEKNA